jgi:hypothetical protein
MSFGGMLGERSRRSWRKAILGLRKGRIVAMPREVELDIETPGRLVATARNAKRYRILLVAEPAAVTADALERDPRYNGPDVVAAADLPDAGGKAILDLAPLKEKLAKLQPASVLASFVVGFPGEGDTDPRVVTGPSLRLKPALAVKDARWSVIRASVEDEVEFRVELEGRPPAGAVARFKVFDHDEGGAHALVAELEAPANGVSLAMKWKVLPPKFDRDATAAALAAQGFDHPDLFFEVTIGQVRADSGTARERLLVVEDVIDRLVLDEAQRPIPDAEYEVVLSNGQKRRGKLSAESRIFERAVPPGRFDLHILRPARVRPVALPAPRPAVAREKAEPVDLSHHDRVYRRGPVRIGEIEFAPPAPRAGDEVTIAVRVANASGGPVAFRIFENGAAAPVAELSAPLAGDRAEARWRVSELRAPTVFDVDVIYKDKRATTRGSSFPLRARPAPRRG